MAGKRATRAPARSRDLAAGYLAMLPLLLAYEASPGPARSVAERVVTLPLAPLGQAAGLGRVLLVALVAALSVGWLLRDTRGTGTPGLLPECWRVVREGAVAALCLGPLLLLLFHALGVDEEARALRFSGAGAGTPLGRAVFLAGGAAWEEILFRVGIQGGALVAARHALRFLSHQETVERVGAEIVSIAVSASLFAAAHLAALAALLGRGGEAFDPAVFTWRLLAGILLGILYRWRGPGVAAWAHALFDLGLSIGAGPGVFL